MPLLIFFLRYSCLGFSQWNTIYQQKGW